MSAQGCNGCHGHSCRLLFAAAHAAVPDHAAAAMENWGLLLYHETALLYDAMTSSAAHKQFVAIIVSHELAHMVKQHCMLRGLKWIAVIVHVVKSFVTPKFPGLYLKLR